MLNLNLWRPKSATHPAARPEGAAQPAALRPLLRIVVLNTKGGCGKTTLATNLAGYYACHGYHTALLDTIRRVPACTGSHTAMPGAHR